MFDGFEIIASFHTHPNTGSDYLQEPSETGKRAVRDDPDLKSGEYVGEFIVSQKARFDAKSQNREDSEKKGNYSGRLGERG